MGQSLHYGVYLLAGFLVAGVALATVGLDTTDTPEAMLFFAAIGGVFILIGLTKFIIKKMKDVKEGERELRNKIAGGMLDSSTRQQAVMQRSQQQNRPHQSSPQNRPQVIRCSRCGAPNYSTSNFCHKCGVSLR